MKYTFQNNNFEITRYPETNDRSLRAWNAGDEYLLNQANDLSLFDRKIVIYNDRFGFLSSFFNQYKPLTVIDHKSQEKAMLKNLMANGLEFDKSLLKTPLDDIKEEIDIAFIKIPKSLDHFSLYLAQINKALKKDGQVICAFMTRHFSPQILKIAETFFEVAEQSLALKKARVLILKKPIKREDTNLINELKSSESENLKQYLGVFSGKKVDHATEFLIKNMSANYDAKKVLDLGSGNGILAMIIRAQNKLAEIHLMDDFWLAVASSKLNLPESKTFFHWNNELSFFGKGTFDLVVSNPPFHFGHENNIDVTLNLFQGVKRILTDKGVFELVANKHLNYKSHLEKIFRYVDIIAENEKFVVYSCS